MKHYYGSPNPLGLCNGLVGRPKTNRQMCEPPPRWLRRSNPVTAWVVWRSNARSFVRGIGGEAVTAQEAATFNRWGLA